jgi:hypothetical protein
VCLNVRYKYNRNRFIFQILFVKVLQKDLEPVGVMRTGEC